MGGDAELPEIACLIESDPALTAELLSLANSPLFGTASEISTVSRAVTLLGFERIKALTSTVAMRVFARTGRKTAALRNCWLHSVACALLAGELGTLYGFHKDHAYTAGLLHDIGRFGLLAAYPQGYTRLVLERHESIQEVLRAERRLSGVDHCEAGLLLSQSWELPETLAAVAGYHHDETLEEKPGLTPLVRFACQIADSLRFEAVRYESVPSFDELRVALPGALRDRFRFSLEELEERIVNNVYSLDSL
jgi:HD-like signal output (HDOD) protein